ncbi:MAG: DMT family transporter [Marinovum sp.]|nr:DMT family transporter [Marinovum sp.]
MNQTTSRGLFGILLIMGLGWALTIPFAKIAVSEGYGHFGLIFWQLVLAGGVLGGVMFVRGGRLSLAPRHLKVYAVIACLGTIFPNSVSYQAAVHLPAGIMAITISSVPLMAFPIALILGMDRFDWRRLAGLCAGFVAVCLIVLPDTSLPDPALIGWVFFALIGPSFYAMEGNYVAKWGTEGLDPIATLTGASVLGAITVLPLALGTGQFIDPLQPWGLPNYAHLAGSLIHAVVYTLYVWMVSRAGPTFASQVAYLVTGFGVLWSMLILGERYDLFVWAALGLMLVGMALVQPRDTKTLGKDGPDGKAAVQN